MKKDCPDRKKNNFKKDRFKKKQAFSVTWDDSESSSSDSDNDSDAEQANVCFMATNNNVSDFSFEDLLEINSELLDKFKIVKKECKETKEKLHRAEIEIDMLRDEKKILEEELVNAQESCSDMTSQLSMLCREIETQKDKNSILASENNELKYNNKILELDISSLKSKLENISKNVSNFNKGRENLTKIIENSQNCSNKRGI